MLDERVKDMKPRSTGISHWLLSYDRQPTLQAYQNTAMSTRLDILSYFGAIEESVMLASSPSRLYTCCARYPRTKDNPMSKVVTIRSRRPVLVKELVSRVEYIELLETIETYIEQVKPLRKKPNGLDNAVKIIQEMKFVGSLNHKFRQETFHELEDLSDDLYIEIHE